MLRDISRNIFKVSALFLCAQGVFAGGEIYKTKGEMPSCCGPNFQVEAGVAYAYNIYKSSVKAPESYTNQYPNGFSFDPKDHFPKSFWGGYAGFTLGMQNWFINSKLNIYGSESKSDNASGVKMTMSPVRATLLVGKKVYESHNWYGNLGLGAVVHANNKGEMRDDNPGDTFSPGNERSHSTDGRTRLDGLVAHVNLVRVSV